MSPPPGTTSAGSPPGSECAPGSISPIRRCASSCSTSTAEDGRGLVTVRRLGAASPTKRSHTPSCAPYTAVSAARRRSAPGDTAGLSRPRRHCRSVATSMRWSTDSSPLKPADTSGGAISGRIRSRYSVALKFEVMRNAAALERNSAAAVSRPEVAAAGRPSLLCMHAWRRATVAICVSTAKRRWPSIHQSSGAHAGWPAPDVRVSDRKTSAGNAADNPASRSGSGRGGICAASRAVISRRLWVRAVRHSTAGSSAARRIPKKLSCSASPAVRTGSSIFDRDELPGDHNAVIVSGSIAGCASSIGSRLGFSERPPITSAPDSRTIREHGRAPDCGQADQMMVSVPESVAFVRPGQDCPGVTVSSSVAG